MSIITHSEHFHCDEVFACALLLELRLVVDETKITRTRDKKTLEDAVSENKEENLFVVDVGLHYDPERNLFDHHQAGCCELYSEKSKIPMSSFGMVYKRFCDRLFSKKEDQDSFYFRYVAPIDGSDNGVIESTAFLSNRNYKNVNIQDVISAFNTPKKQSKEQEAAFLQALQLARTVLSRWISEHDRKSKEREKNEIKFRRSCASLNYNLVILKENFPYQDYLFKLEKETPQAHILFVVLPREDTPDQGYGYGQGYEGPFQIHTVETTKFVQRAKILDQEKARDLIGEDLRFVHEKRFIAVTSNFDSACELALASIKEHEKNNTRQQLLLISAVLILVLVSVFYFKASISTV